GSQGYGILLRAVEGEHTIVSGHFLNRKAACHPDRPHFAKGLCRKCYGRTLKRNRPIAKCKRCGKSKHIAGNGNCHTCFCILRREAVKIPLLKKQKNKCAVRGCTTDTSQYTLSDWRLDHDHLCCKAGSYCAECVRGVICIRCNLILGCTAESPSHLQGLLKYLKKAGGN